MRRWGCVLTSLFVLGAIAFVLWIYTSGRLQHDTSVGQTPLSRQSVESKLARQSRVDVEPATQILFGDLHVHTTFSVDAFMWSLPLMGGEGVHPPADACDFARYCSQLDFYALTDHAEALNPRTWGLSKESVRQCNAVAGDASDPDLVAFTGFEWTQVGLTRDEHYGHKNVIFKYTDDARLPVRPIAAPGIATRAFKSARPSLDTLLIPLSEYPNHRPYLDFVKHIQANRAIEECSTGIDTRKLPSDCLEFAEDPATLFSKLHQWNFDTLVIPHGMTWGFYTPRGYTWDKQLSTEQDDPELQDLVEVFSGHGNSEEYRSFRGTIPNGEQEICPAPTSDYEPCCYRAGEIIRSRCGDASEQECERRVQKAQQDYLRLGVAAHVSLDGVDVPGWGECGQCKDCFNPSFNYRPAGSAQYMLARGNFDDPEAPRHQTMGFLASSDNHSARSGTGYKEFARKQMTEARGTPSEGLRRRMFGERGDPKPESNGLTFEDFKNRPPFSLMALERQASFFITGGLVAVHSENRSREAIWDALDQRHVYGTSGDRMLLWFDLVNAPNGKAPMGSELTLATVPKFVVRAAGSFEQAPGCAEEVVDAIGDERLGRLCAGECYNPTASRRRITRIEVVRIRRQMKDDEEIAPLIEDVWKSIPCPSEAEACEVEFEDPGYPTLGRDVLYYVRAIQEPTPAVNADRLRCKDGSCTPCYGNYRTDNDDDCLAPNEERAWSSPIYLRVQR